MSASQIRAELDIDEISSRTVQRRLNQGGLHGRRPVKKPLISKKNIKVRLEFARDHLNWMVDDWKKVLWSDESKFNLFNSDGKCYVYRPVNERFNPKYTSPTVKFSGGNIMVWGCFSWNGVGPLHRIKGKMDQTQYREILETVMLPHANEKMPRNWTFMHDNDPKHTAMTVKTWLSNTNIQCIKWPAQSPDLNPIENLWEEVKRKLHGQKFSNQNALFDAVKTIWNELSIDLIHRLIESLPRRCKAVIDSKGFSTKY